MLVCKHSEMGTTVRWSPFLTTEVQRDLLYSYLLKLTQTAYQKGVSCTDAIFAYKEIIAKLTREGDHVYSCFYDLASAFDTVEYPVLLSHLMSAGITGVPDQALVHQSKVICSC